MVKENQTLNITSDTVVMLEGQMPEGQSTSTSSLRGSTAKVGFAISTLFGSGVAITTIPAATTIMAEAGGAVATEAAFPVVVKLVGGATALGTLISCEKDTPKPVDPNAIDRTTDNPKHKEAYMADVKPIVLGGGVATLDFDAEWQPLLKEYQLQPKSMVDFGKAASKVEEIALKYNKKTSDLTFDLYYQNSKTRIVWSIPYSLLKEISGSQNLNSDAFDKYRLVTDVIPDGGNPDASTSKGDQGYLEISIGNSNHVGKVEKLHVINPYYFGK